MVTLTARHKAREATYAGRRAANSRYVDWLARAGLTARGIIYALIGFLAIEIAFGNSGHRADQSGAVRVVASRPVGTLLLWLPVGGFIAGRGALAQTLNGAGADGYGP